MKASANIDMLYLVYSINIDLLNAKHGSLFLQVLEVGALRVIKLNSGVRLPTHADQLSI